MQQRYKAPSNSPFGGEFNTQPRPPSNFPQKGKPSKDSHNYSKTMIFSISLKCDRYIENVEIRNYKR